jgi:3-oxoacyl-[acyl-carrier-protein] synthase-3
MVKRGASVGIHGVGVFLPPEVRTNDWWPREVVAKWSERVRSDFARRSQDPTPGEAVVLAEMAAVRADPFQGAERRHVMAPGMKSSDMETAAARAALEDAGTAPSEIDVVLSASMCPDAINSPNACLVHRRLGLPARCFALQTEAACNSFQMQLGLAEGFIATGRARRVLLVQSSSLSPMMPWDQPFSAWFGDGASAVVVGPVSDGRGILGSDHYVDGQLHGALECGPPGGSWWEGRAVVHTPDLAKARALLLGVVDRAQQSVGGALARAGLGPDDVDFYASHQATVWFRRATQDFIGLTRARYLDTFPWAANLSPANLPLQLSLASREGLLHDGDVVAMHSGGTGIVWSATVLRWGR